jgi:hypothetical protein
MTVHIKPDPGSLCITFMVPKILIPIFRGMDGIGNSGLLPVP